MTEYQVLKWLEIQIRIMVHQRTHEHSRAQERTHRNSAHITIHIFFEVGASGADVSIF